MKEQGSDRQPQPKLGPAVMNMEAKGIRTEKGDEFRRVNAENRALERKQKRQAEVHADIERERKFEELLAQPTAVSAEDLSVIATSKSKSEQYTDSDLLYDFGSTDRQVERKRADGVAEVVLRSVDPELLERVQSRLVETDKPRLRVERKQEQAKPKEQKKKHDLEMDL